MYFHLWLESILNIRSEIPSEIWKKAELVKRMTIKQATKQCIKYRRQMNETKKQPRENCCVKKRSVFALNIIHIGVSMFGTSYRIRGSQSHAVAVWLIRRLIGSGGCRGETERYPILLLSAASPF